VPQFAVVHGDLCKDGGMQRARDQASSYSVPGVQSLHWNRKTNKKIKIKFSETQKGKPNS
jgi:hypothetical protein